jgi:deoxycytidylate deaminase
VSNESLHIVSIGYKTEKYHAELHALMNAKKSQVDLTTCSLYTTNYPCAHCIMAILRCGIRVVVHGGEKDKSTKGMVNHAKACFKKYECYIAKTFTINLSGWVVSPVYPDEKLERSQELPALPPYQADQVNPAEQDKPSYTDFFMAMAFLSSTRSKDKNCSVWLSFQTICVLL